MRWAARKICRKLVLEHAGKLEFELQAVDVIEDDESLFNAPQAFTDQASPLYPSGFLISSCSRFQCAFTCFLMPGSLIRRPGFDQDERPAALREPSPFTGVVRVDASGEF